MSNYKNLFLITEEYPFGIGESFIENEIKFLSKSFEKVIIISKAKSVLTKRDVPKNVIVDNYNFKINFFQKIKSIKYLFSFVFLAEFFGKRNFRITKTNISYALISVLKAKNFCKFLKSKLVIHNKDDSIFYTYWFMDETLALCFLKDSLPKSKFISRAHRMDLYFYAHKNNYLPYRNYILKKIDTIYTVSHDGKKYLEKNFTSFDNIKVSYLGTSPIQNINSINSHKTYRIISCSNIYPNKRVHLIAEILQKINVKLQWDHYGGFISYTSKAYRDKFNNLIFNNKDLDESIKFHGGISNKEYIKKVKKTKYDLFINLSESEGVPVSIMEAFSFGIPVIATNVGGVSELVINNYNGFLLEKNFKIADAIDILMNFYKMDTSEIIKLKTNAYLTWEKKFNAEKNYNFFISEIKKIKK